MKAAQLTGPKTIEIKEVFQPVADDKKVLLKIERCGICGSDLHIWENGAPQGLIMGNEFARVIEDFCGDASGLEKGLRVTAMPSNPCGTCEACKRMEYNRCLNILADAPGITTPGAFTRYISISRDSVCPLPEGMTFNQGAMVEPSAVALHAVTLTGVCIKQAFEKLIDPNSDVVKIMVRV